jgi:hypothetical protein
VALKVEGSPLAIAVRGSSTVHRPHLHRLKENHALQRFETRVVGVNRLHGQASLLLVVVEKYVVLSHQLIRAFEQLVVVVNEVVVARNQVLLVSLRPN